MGGSTSTMTTARTRHLTARLLLSLAALALAAFAASPASAAQAAAKKSASPCWLRIVNDWLDNGRVDTLYPIPCYQQAINHLNGYTDVAGYSSAVDDIQTARSAAIRAEKDGGSGQTTTSGTGSTSGLGGGGPNDGGSNGGGDGGGGGKSFIQRLGDRLGPGNAQSIPLPLLVLGGLAVLLLLAALATWLARRVQARRVTPAPAPARRH